ncbi:GPN-loop GTPase QQT2 [Nosema granulosis]|uniref:GPN-loop GTPase n=1 Tax=Nosema granulosis TaxID=83296 RepID=A0A9P6GZ30_9MICR|nr:GPN-loop GTPase QQT2 [Nosema granulosis]
MMSKDTQQNIKNDPKNVQQNTQQRIVEDKLSNLKIKEKTIFLVVGMAGAGKTTFCQRLYSWISQDNCKIDSKTGLNSSIYSINLDPAVLNCKMPLNLDIRDYVDYNGVMEKYNIGPNGAITTSLNLFLLNIEERVQLGDSEYVIIDTPGQIETFTWSSPGYIIRDFFKSAGKVVMVYLVDSYASADASVFMSNMMYAISLMCRYEIPVLCTFNKIDIEKSNLIEEWIRDYEVFRSSLDENKLHTPLLGSMALHFEEFYNSIDTVSISSSVGSGKEAFFKKVKEVLEKY